MWDSFKKAFGLKPWMAAKPVTSYQVFEKAAVKFMLSRKSINDLYKFTVMSHYCMKNGLSYDMVQLGLIKAGWASIDKDEKEKK